MDAALFKRLLLEGESSHLDFKSQQYAFVGATEDEKSELLKDILAMSNAWREGDAFILVGVRERAGRSAEIVGMSGHLDDAALQQFVTSKTNRPVDFSYSEFEVDGTPVAAITIPVQQRPFYLNRAYGNLRAGVVYLRRGSSTDEADPDEIHRMGEASGLASRVPRLDLQFGDDAERTLLGSLVTIEKLWLDPLSDDELPRVSSAMPYPHIAAETKNQDYYREGREYLFQREAAGAFGFGLLNTSTTLAIGTRAQFILPVSDEYQLWDRRPRKPRQMNSWIEPVHLPPAVVHDVDVQRTRTDWHVEVRFGSLQPGARTWSADRLWIATRQAMVLELEGHVYGDNFEPVPVRLEVDSRPGRRPMTLKDLNEALKHRR